MCQNNETFLRSLIVEAKGPIQEDITIVKREREVELPEEDLKMDAAEIVVAMEEEKDDAKVDQDGAIIIKCPVCWHRCAGYKGFESHAGTHVTKDVSTNQMSGC